jgi:hypothetical protein
MGLSDEFKLALKSNVCIEGLSEDTVRQLVDSLQVVAKDTANYVKSSGGVQVKVQFGSDGTFNGIYARLNGIQIPLVLGVGSTALQLFKGGVTSVNPGPGWQVEYDLTIKYLNAPPDETAWELFYASRVSTINP